jgi:hypothetical protein
MEREYVCIDTLHIAEKTGFRYAHRDQKVLISYPLLFIIYEIFMGFVKRWIII